jgi:hypothetical protein
MRKLMISILLLIFAVASPVEAQGVRGQRGEARPFPLLDLMEIVVLQRQLLAVDAGGGGQVEEKLQRGEEVVWTGSRGRVGVVLTNQRILAVSTISASWQSTRFMRGEKHPVDATLGDRVALLLTNKRAIGFDGNTGNLVEKSLGPNEVVIGSAVGENVAVVITPRRALGLSAFTGGFFQTRISVGDRLEGTSAQANLVTLTFSDRLLFFRAPTGSWEERDLNIR